MDVITLNETENEINVTVVDDVIVINPDDFNDVGTTNHAALVNRGIPDQHPQSAITDLTADLLNITDDVGELHDLQSTSWILGAAVSVNTDPAKFDISAGEGQHVDHSSHPPIVTHVTIAAQTALTVTDLATQISTEIGVDKNGNIVQQFRFTPEERRDNFTIGLLVHPDFTTLAARPLARVLSHEVALTTTDLALAIGSLNVSGVVFQTNGANLKLNVTAGVTFSIGINKDKIKNSNYVNSVAVGATTFFHTWQDGSGGFNLFETDELDPNNYDDGTGGALAPSGTILPNKWQLMRVFIFPVEDPRLSVVIIHYGTDTFGTSEEALNDLGIDFISNPALDNAVHRANIAVIRGATDLTDPSQAIISTVGKFGHVGGGGAGVGVTDHELLSNLLGGATNDHQHLTTAELAKLTGIETGATADQTKADIDGLGIDAETLDGLDSTDFELVSKKDATGGYAGLTLFKINFKNALNTFTSFFTNSNTAARTYTFQDRDGTIADDTDLAGKVNTAQVLTNVPSGAVFTDTLYDDSLVLKDSDTVSPVTGGNKLITQTDIVAAEDNFSYENSTSAVTVPVNQQMIVYQEFEVILDLTIEGTMVVL